MGSNYIEMRLEDCMDAIIDYRGKTPKKVDNGIPLITAKIIKNGRIQEVNEFIAIDDYDNWMVRGLPLEGDVVLTTEAPLGEVAQLDARKVALAQRVITLRGKKGILENDYLLYLLQSSFVQNQLDGRASGSTVTGIKQSELREIILRLPPTTLQKSISHQLKCLDKKIDLNNKINQTLEQMAQTLFKSWFVDFDPVIDNALDAGKSIPEALQSRAELRQKVRNSADFKPLPADIRTLFPAEFEETELGWVPRDWYYVPLKNLGKIICGKTPDKSNKEYYGKDYLFIKIPDMHGKVFVTNSTDKLSTLGSETQIKKLIPKGSICVSCIATVGIVAINSKDCHTNQQINSIVPNSSILRNYLYFSMLEKNKTFHDLASGGSATLNMNTGIFSNVLTLKPEDSVLERFQQTSEHWFGRILANENEIHTLTALRDTLLPKLISGELSLEDLPDLVTQTEPA